MDDGTIRELLSFWIGTLDQLVITGDLHILKIRFPLATFDYGYLGFLHHFRLSFCRCLHHLVAADIRQQCGSLALGLLFVVPKLIE